MSRPTILTPNLTRVAAHVHAIGTRGGEPLLAIGGALFVMSHKSGWCLDGLHGDACRWARCACDCHGEAA